MKKIWHFIKNYYKIFVPIIIILIPFAIFVWSIIDASLSSNEVIVGNRYRNDLDPAIETVMVDELKESIEGISSIEKVDVVLRTSQLRVVVDVKDSVVKEDYEQLLKDIYDKVDQKISIDTYFTKKTTGKKMYDLEINAYNDLNSESGFILYTLVKNSTMDEPIIALSSDPKDPALVEQLKLKEQQDKEGTSDTPETTPQFEEELEEELVEEETVE